MNKLQEQLFGIWVEVQKVCTSKKIKLIPWCGTLLGAARHKGFIPWDDDMDFAVIDDDFEKIIIALKENLPERFYVSTSKKDRTRAMHIQIFDTSKKADVIKASKKEYKHPGIDIMALVTINNNNGNTFKNRLWSELNWAKNVNLKSSSWWTGFMRPFLILFSQKFLYKKVRNRANKIKDQNGKYVYEFSAGYYKTFNKEWLIKNTSTLFEGKEMIIPKYFNEILNVHYGDWKKIPPKEEWRIHIKKS